jgi:hypothetical protein
MKKFFLLVFMILGGLTCLEAQYVYTIKADSVKLTNCDSSELIIENHTQTVHGFLFNTGDGRTIFKKGIEKLNDSLYVIGADTLKTAVHPWVQGGNAFGTTGFLGTLDSNSLDIYTNRSLRARFTAKGELLIGTTANPFNDQLVVNGSAFFGNGTHLDLGDLYSSGRLFSVGTLQLQGNATTNPQIYMGNQIGAGFTGNTIISMSTGTSTLSNPNQDILEITGNGGRQVAAFRAAGRVLLGGPVDDGVHTLQVNGPIAAQNVLLNGSLGGTAVLSAYRPVDFAIMNIASVPDVSTLRLGGGNQNSVDIYGHTVFIARFSNNGGGQMGLGTTSPAAQLHTTGTVRFAGLTADSTQTRVLVGDANGNLFYRDASTLAANETIRSSLAVNGPITAQKLTLSAHDWPDYVFDSAYDLPSPDSLRHYIKQNNHLPDAPSAVEVDRKGVDVGDNQKLLLKKIEELTLYMLKQEERIQNLEQQLQQQSKIIDKLKNTR